ncbi:MAG: WecB/TagA/CpsF family glycosyltransferase, partial [Thermomicrobiales bacterium]|nr:WecB/TagA/CpsF family glycosyltransferase [Thermomicrobiales bacterium]
ADSASPGSDRIDLFGIEISTMRRAEIERRIVVHMSNSGRTLLHIATVNPEYVVAAHRNPAFCAALRNADLRLADGIGVVLAGRWLAGTAVERFTGVELVQWLLEDLERTPRVFLLGNAASIADLQGRHPIRVVGRWGGGTPRPEDDDASIERIRARDATVVLVGYGAPGQVEWIERNRAALKDAEV